MSILPLTMKLDQVRKVWLEMGPDFLDPNTGKTGQHRSIRICHKAYIHTQCQQPNLGLEAAWQPSMLSRPWAWTSATTLNHPFGERAHLVPSLP